MIGLSETQDQKFRRLLLDFRFADLNAIESRLKFENLYHASHLKVLIELCDHVVRTDNLFNFNEVYLNPQQVSKELYISEEEIMSSKLLNPILKDNSTYFLLSQVNKIKWIELKSYEGLKVQLKDLLIKVLANGTDKEKAETKQRPLGEFEGIITEPDKREQFLEIESKLDSEDFFNKRLTHFQLASFGLLLIDLKIIEPMVRPGGYKHKFNLVRMAEALCERYVESKNKVDFLKKLKNVFSTGDVKRKPLEPGLEKIKLILRTKVR